MKNSNNPFYNSADPLADAIRNVVTTSNEARIDQVGTLAQTVSDGGSRFDAGMELKLINATDAERKMVMEGEEAPANGENKTVKGKDKGQEEGDEDSTLDDDGGKTKKEKIEVNPTLTKEEQELDEASYDIDMMGVRGSRGKHSITARTTKEALYKVRRKEGLGAQEVHSSSVTEPDPDNSQMAIATEETTKMRFSDCIKEASAAADFRRHGGGRKRGKDSADVDNSSEEDATDGSGNLIMQLRKAVSVKKPVVFADGKKEKVDMRMAQKAQTVFAAIRGADRKEAWMKKASASLKGLQAAVNEEIEAVLSGKTTEIDEGNVDDYKASIAKLEAKKNKSSYDSGRLKKMKERLAKNEEVELDEAKETTAADPLVAIWMDGKSPEYPEQGHMGHMNLSTAAAIHAFKVGDLAPKVLALKGTARMKVKSGVWLEKSVWNKKYFKEDEDLQEMACGCGPDCKCGGTCGGNCGDSGCPCECNVSEEVLDEAKNDGVEMYALKYYDKMSGSSRSDKKAWIKGTGLSSGDQKKLSKLLGEEDNSGYTSLSNAARGVMRNSDNY